MSIILTIQRCNFTSNIGCVRDSDHAAAEGTGPGLGVTRQLILLHWLSSKRVERHRAAVAAERATAQRFPAAA